MHNPFSGETPFPPAGEGVVLRFTASDLARLHSIYGPDVRRPPDVDPRTGHVAMYFWGTVLGWLSVHDPVVIGNLLKIGLKERNASGKLVPIQRDEDWWESPPFSYSEVADMIEAGLMWSRWGMTPEQLAEKLREQSAAGEAASVDPTMNGQISPISSDL
jgi:hypothetical protein